MKKIISVFQRNYDTDRLIRNEVVPGAEWVLSGEGTATRKFDGSCCMILDGVLYKRYDCKQGKEPPIGFIPAQDPDPVTGHWPGWVECSHALPEDRWFLCAMENAMFPNPLEAKPCHLADGTYEACGPHFQRNQEGFLVDVLIRHGVEALAGCPRDFTGIREYLRDKDIEGVVFHHPDGRMAKVKKRDYGMKRRT